MAYGVLRIEGTDASETLSIRQVNNQIEVAGTPIFRNGQPLARVDTVDVNGIEVRGNGGNDTIRITSDSSTFKVPVLSEGGAGKDTLFTTWLTKGVSLDGGAVKTVQVGTKTLQLQAKAQLFDVANAGSTLLTSNVNDVLTSRGGGGTPVALLLANRQFQQYDGQSLSTIDFGHPITALAVGHDAAGPCYYALTEEGILFKDGSAGVVTLTSGVHALVQSRSGAGEPVALILRNLQLQVVRDTTITAVDLGHRITKLAEGRDQSGPCYYALTSDGVLFKIGAIGVQVVAFQVWDLMQSHDGNGEPVGLALHKSQLEVLQNSRLTPVRFAKPIIAMAAGRDANGPCYYVLQQDYIQGLRIKLCPIVGGW